MLALSLSLTFNGIENTKINELLYKQLLHKSNR